MCSQFISWVLGHVEAVDIAGIFPILIFESTSCSRSEAPILCSAYYVIYLSV